MNNTISFYDDLKKERSFLFNPYLVLKNEFNYEPVLKDIHDELWKKYCVTKGYKKEVRRKILQQLIVNLIYSIYYKKLIAISLNSNDYRRKEKVQYKGLSYKLFKEVYNFLVKNKYAIEIRGYWNGGDNVRTRIYPGKRILNLISKYEIKHSVYLKGAIIEKKHNGKTYKIYKQIFHNNNKSDEQLQIRKRNGRKKTSNNEVINKHNLPVKQQDIIKSMEEQIKRYNIFAEKHTVILVDNYPPRNILHKSLTEKKSRLCNVQAQRS